MKKGRRGFTLVELMIALGVVGLAMTLALQVFAALADTNRRTMALRQEFAREVNAWAWLRATIASLDVDVDSSSTFDGTHAAMRFHTWLLTGDGWFERGTVEIRSSERGLVVHGGGRMIVLSDAQAQFDYLVDLGADARWLRRWRSRVVAPRAVRVRVMPRGSPVDTLIFAVGDRG